MISYAKAGAELLRLLLHPCSQPPSLPFLFLRHPGRMALSSHHLRRQAQLWKWSLDCIGDLKLLEVAELWHVCQEREVWCEQQSWKDGAQGWKETPKASDISHRTIGSGVGPAGSLVLFLVQYFLTVPMSLHFGMVMYILYLGMLEVSDLLFDFTGGYKDEVALSLGGDFGL